MSEQDSRDMEGEGGRPLKRRRTMRGRRGGENNDLPPDGRRAGPSRSLRPRNPSKGKQPKKQPSSSNPVPPPNNPSNTVTARPLPTNTVSCNVARPDQPPSPEVINLCTPSPEDRGRSNDTTNDQDASMSPMTRRPSRAREENIQTVPVITPGLDTGFMMTPVNDRSTSGPLRWRQFSRPGLRSQRHPQGTASSNRIALRGHIWTEVQPPPPSSISSPPTTVGTETLIDFDSSLSALFDRDPPTSVGSIGREPPSSLGSFLATSPMSFNHGLRSPFTPVPPPSSSPLYMPTFSDYHVSSSRDVPNRPYYGGGQSRVEAAASGLSASSYRPPVPGTLPATSRRFYGPSRAVKVEGTTSGVSVPTHRPSDSFLGLSRERPDHSSHWSNLDPSLGSSRERPDHSSHWSNLNPSLGSSRERPDHSSHWSSLDSSLGSSREQPDHSSHWSSLDSFLGSSRERPDHSSHWSSLDSFLGSSRERPDHNSHWSNLDTSLGERPDQSSHWSNLDSSLGERPDHSSHWSNVDSSLGERPDHSSHWSNLDTSLGLRSRWNNLESQLDRLDFIASQSSRRDGGSSRPNRGQAGHDPLSFRFQMSGGSNGMSSPRQPSQRFGSRPMSSARSNTRHPTVLRPTVAPFESRTLPARDTAPPSPSVYSSSESGSRLGGDGDSADASSSGIHVSINIVRLGEGSMMRGREDGGRMESTEVIVVDDDSSSSDDDDDVIINGVELGHPQRWRQIASDEAYARDLQAQFDRESSSLDQRYPPSSTHLWSSTGPSGVVPAAPSIPSLAEQQEEEERDGDPRLTTTTGTDLMRDNFDALATRVTGWTRNDAGRFLRVASHGRRRRPRTRRDLMNAVLELSPAIIYRAIMGPFSPGASSYEDLLELAESLGPARPQGLSSEAINSLPLKEFSASKETEGSSEKTSCVVCMCEFIERDKIRSLPCLHDFHQKCIDHWLKDHKTCPICRVEVQ